MDETRSTRPTVVLYPGAGEVGHVTPMAELAKAFVTHGYPVKLVLIDPSGSGATSAVARRVAAAYDPRITVHVLPPVPPSDSDAASKITNALLLLPRRYNGALERFLRSTPVPVRCLVVDAFCVDAIDVAARLGVPVYTFVAACASALAALIQVPALLAGRKTGLKELGDAPLQFLGVPPVPASHLVRSLLERPDNERCRAMADVWARCTATGGVLVNTFESLERPAVQALRDPRCVPGRALPPVYCVGPLLNGEDGGAERHECLAWLDALPERSVVFLCFGSKAAHSAEQLREIAVGLDRSGHRFLWVIRAPAGNDEDREGFLPEGFLQRTQGRGLVVRSWAPQADILQHPSTGAFVTHCGWNSTLEAVAAGVPMLCWPMHAEQRMNKVSATAAHGMAVGIEVEVASATGLVGAGEVEAKVRLVMESAEGEGLRARAAAWKEARAATAEGGAVRGENGNFAIVKQSFVVSSSLEKTRIPGRRRPTGCSPAAADAQRQHTTTPARSQHTVTRSEIQSAALSCGPALAPRSTCSPSPALAPRASSHAWRTPSSGPTRLRAGAPPCPLLHAGAKRGPRATSGRSTVSSSRRRRRAPRRRWRQRLLTAAVGTSAHVREQERRASLGRRRRLEKKVPRSIHFFYDSVRPTLILCCPEADGEVWCPRAWRAGWTDADAGSRAPPLAGLRAQRAGGARNRRGRTHVRAGRPWLATAVSALASGPPPRVCAPPPCGPAWGRPWRPHGKAPAVAEQSSSGPTSSNSASSHMS